MIFKSAIEKHSGLGFIFNGLNIVSSLGNKAILETRFSKDEDYLISKYSIIESCQNYLSEEINLKTLTKVRAVLSYTNDISGTIRQLEQNQVLDDISLFQIKQFSISCYKISSLLFDIDKYLDKDEEGKLNLPDHSQAIKILDPEGFMLNQFYIYNAYSRELANKRKEWEIVKKKDDEDEINRIYSEIDNIENEIREKLSVELRVYVKDLNKSIELIGEIDKVFALAEFFLEIGRAHV